MDFSSSTSEQELRQELRDLIRTELPASFLGAFTDDPEDLATTQRFCKMLGSRRLLTLAWPREFGGQAGSVWEQTVLREEMWAHHEPRGAQYMGINWVGPALMRFGTEDQRNVHLPRIADGSTIWCQGFSEPDAGSDLASLTTRAERDGDGWNINGQQIWTSYATMAQWCFLLARTSKGSSKHHGITVFLIEMDQPGVEVRPIPSMMGPHHLNEVFFDNAWAGPEAVLGDVDDGWNIVRAALAFERVGIARYARSERLLNLARSVLGDRWADLPGDLKHRWLRALIHSRQARLLAYTVIEGQDKDRVDPADAAAYRVAVTRLDQETAEVLMEIVDLWSAPASPSEQIFVSAVEDHWKYAQASTVASGSIEMQQVLLARTALSR